MGFSWRVLIPSRGGWVPPPGTPSDAPHGSHPDLVCKRLARPLAPTIGGGYPRQGTFHAKPPMDPALREPPAGYHPGTIVRATRKARGLTLAELGNLPATRPPRCPGMSGASPRSPTSLSCAASPARCPSPRTYSASHHRQRPALSDTATWSP